MTGPYDDIINLPHHVSASHPQMPVANRAAQFSPFAALTGFDAAIQETVRQTDKRIELSESGLAALDDKLCILTDHIADQPEIAVTYFLPDDKKDGGKYITEVGTVRRIDYVLRTIVFVDAKTIALDDVLDIECDLFIGLE
ncbi:YolD-like family protein [Christensenellaceae bacterium OttesenSCG-928-K19]|nr:YolD-like family protein [Christensenellaceae bacterium OttesenSCG-928-K19]